MAIITTDYGIVKPPPGCQLDYGNPINSGLVGCWLFNEKSGTRLTDYSGNNNHGVLTGFAMNGAISNWVGSPDGGAMAFDGSSDYALCSNPWADNPTKYTISCWLLTKNSATSQIFFNWKNTGTVHLWFQMDINANTFRMIVGAGAANLEVATSGTITSNKWYNVVGVRNDNITSIYVNGVFNASDSSKTIGTITNPNNFVIGAQSSDFSAGLNGYMSRAALWKRVLTPMEISQQYSQPNIGIQSPTYYIPS